jgi:hypothetical protein
MRAATASVISLAEIRRNLPMLRGMLRRGKNRRGREGVDRTQQNHASDRSFGRKCLRHEGCFALI